MMAAADIQVVKKTGAPGAVFSILIPTWNNLPYLQLCIRSLRQNSAFQHQIIVHVNEGKDGTREWLAQQTDIDYAVSEQNIGVCYALNSCRSMADTCWIVYMNDDMYACPGWDKALLEEIETIGHHNFFLSATAIEPRAQSACSIEKDYGRDVNSFDEAKLLQEAALLPMQDWQGATWPPKKQNHSTQGNAARAPIGCDWDE